ncbi:MAG: hypothetical protein ACE5JS_16730 [Nitrospinota bacterium]
MPGPWADSAGNEFDRTADVPAPVLPRDGRVHLPLPPVQEFGKSEVYTGVFMEEGGYIQPQGAGCAD